jgi:hypothetical protein
MPPRPWQTQWVAQREHKPFVVAQEIVGDDLNFRCRPRIPFPRSRVRLRYTLSAPPALHTQIGERVIAEPYIPSPYSEKSPGKRSTVVER